MRARVLGLGVAALFPLAVFACGLDDSVVLSGGNNADGGGSDATLGSDAVTTDDASSNDATADANDGIAPNPPVLNVYATTETELYAFDVIASKLTDLGTLTNCGASTNFADLALDSAGQLWMLKQSDAMYKVDRTGNCSGRWVLSGGPAGADGPVIDKISARNFGNPAIVALDGTNNDYYSIDLSATSTGALTKLNTDLFTDAPGLQYGIYDLTCRSDGTCWTALAQSCSAGATSSCLYTFKADGSAVATGLGAINVQPAGLAYAMGALYNFGADGKISKISLTGSPVGQILTVTGAPLPLSWTGAASGSDND